MLIPLTAKGGIWKKMLKPDSKGILMSKKVFVFLSIVIMSSMVVAEDCFTTHPVPEVYDGWRLGVQTWSFRKFTLFEAIDKTRSLGLNWIQVFPGQQVSDKITSKFGPGLTAEEKNKIKAKLEEAGIQIFGFGVVGVSKDESKARELFDFAKEMQIPMIVSEPEKDQFDLIDTLCQEYEIKLAVHNHPKPTRYWNPDTVLEVCKGRSKWIGACTDVGHWVRSGLDPVECLKKLEGRIHDVHIKEIDNGHDVIWGTGQGRIKGILEELHRQNYKGSFSIEYEYHWDNNVPDIRKSVAFFNSVASELNPTGWKPVFEDDLSNATFDESAWAFEDGILVRKGNGDIWTKEKYSDFVLDFEFKLAEGTNSGVFLRAAKHTWLPWPEVQIEDSYGKPITKHTCGAIFDVKEPTVNAVKPAGQWNQMTIIANDERIAVILNNQSVLDIDLNDWKKPHQNPDGTKNKFNVAYKDLPREGWLGFQDHGHDVWYRNVRIKEL